MIDDNGKERMVALISAAMETTGEVSAGVIAEALIADTGGRWHLVHVGGTEVIVQHPITERFGMYEGNLFECTAGMPIIDHMNQRYFEGQPDEGKTFRVYLNDDETAVTGLMEVKE